MPLIDPPFPQRLQRRRIRADERVTVAEPRGDRALADAQGARELRDDLAQRDRVAELPVALRRPALRDAQRDQLQRLGEELRALGLQTRHVDAVLLSAAHEGRQLRPVGIDAVGIDAARIHPARRGRVAELDGSRGVGLRFHGVLQTSFDNVRRLWPAHPQQPHEWRNCHFQNRRQ